MRARRSEHHWLSGLDSSGNSLAFRRGRFVGYNRMFLYGQLVRVNWANGSFESLYPFARPLFLALTRQRANGLETALIRKIPLQYRNVVCGSGIGSFWALPMKRGGGVKFQPSQPGHASIQRQYLGNTARYL